MLLHSQKWCRTGKFRIDRNACWAKAPRSLRVQFIGEVTGHEVVIADRAPPRRLASTAFARERTPCVKPAPPAAARAHWVSRRLAVLCFADGRNPATGSLKAVQPYKDAVVEKTASGSAPSPRPRESWELSIKARAIEIRWRWTTVKPPLILETCWRRHPARSERLWTNKDLGSELLC